mmetsp:Transcript_7096/g.11695  ORF Transcript_7096/g.11695 Transcript_7096/m.11695 type:complete len:89 (+) Transcript_7096:105-371(+)
MKSYANNNGTISLWVNDLMLPPPRTKLRILHFTGEEDVHHVSTNPSSSGDLRIIVTEVIIEVFNFYPISDLLQLLMAAATYLPISGFR